MFDSVWKIWLYELQMSSGPHHLPKITQHDRSLYLDRPLHLGLASCASKRRECNWIQEGCSMNIHEHPWTSMNYGNVINVRNGRSIFKTSRGLWWLFLGPKYWKIWKQPISAKAAKICQDMSRYVKICQDAIVLLFGLNETRVGHPEALGFLAPRPPKSISCFLSRPCSIISNMSQSETNPHIFTHGFDMDWK